VGLLVCLLYFSSFFTVGAVELPNTFTLYNLIGNGGFTNGTVGWNTSNATINVVDNAAACLIVQSNGFVFRTISPTTVIAHKYYYRADVKTDRTLIGIRLGSNNPIVYHTGSNNWETLSGVINPTAGSQSVLLQDTNTSGFTTIYLDNVMAIDLTETFGVGNEPTLQQMNEVVTAWFDSSRYYDFTPTTTTTTSTSPNTTTATTSSTETQTTTSTITETTTTGTPTISSDEYSHNNERYTLIGISMVFGALIFIAFKWW